MIYIQYSTDLWLSKMIYGYPQMIYGYPLLFMDIQKRIMDIH